VVRLLGVDDDTNVRLFLLDSAEKDADRDDVVVFDGIITKASTIAGAPPPHQRHVTTNTAA
jgi:hypothetical protein